ncbi:3-hydroxyacyl-CoA dehydrogenase/enoyl-CoA hydratase/3-hydroxybutyryl-CoA epimerase [Plasticicumulans lactativorans]|uniref:3-hydroxyacyl-CoA dehydrogenase/enoyl-CoA hydratase/3-hydroxybutyryl-CoA epimerase n=1 Tax=Plasticicumulans lactativorans TaxID=1133106 RepID=A0A4R2KY00_9GAMM|nr:3-hydroxyacyl-CoA dehydrogenase NAD-binding domain-containing protein [Plasticicumulans lactativorans]TCO78904.1 3-hydroxyacyl-CoA dehydrogenase/enoyl-CoA hydratase/3-hydroxybutyryl-CoA epimerase [Plasticicumulans lactativorans]
MAAWRHWRCERDLDDVAWLTLDRADATTNSLSAEVLDELAACVAALEAAPPRGLVLQSGKASGFIAGADVREFDALDALDAARARLRAVHATFDRLEALPCPSVAAIRGFCLGGGLELALACRYRIAQDVEATRIGFPEVQLGIFPGFGGSARACARLGGVRALTLMLGARPLGARAARALGLVDEVIGPHQSLRWAARRAVLAGRRTRAPGLLDRIGDTWPVRQVVAAVMTRQVAKKAAPAHYPAPYALIEHWRTHGGSRAALFAGEIERTPELLLGATSRGLRRVFQLMERLKGEAKAAAFSVRRVHVIGAGVMGGDIAAWCALRGCEVTLQDQGIERIRPALARAAVLFHKRLKSPVAVQSAGARLRADPEGRGLPRADVVIEAIFEDLDAKRALFAAIEPRLAPAALLATNTSALPLEALAAGLAAPQRLIGLHFFNPVAQMPLVEVVHGSATAPDPLARGCAFAGAIGKLPLPVRSAPGFLVNRVLAPYLLQALRLHLDDGTPKETLDAAASAFGMPMGPIELADTVGLDVCRQVAGHLGGTEAAAARAQLDALIAAGRLGRKAGRGLYDWRNGRPQRGAADTADAAALAALGERLLAPLLAECRTALAEGIVADADLLDAGVVFGTGFAPFTGGPLRYQGLA